MIETLSRPNLPIEKKIKCKAVFKSQDPVSTLNQQGYMLTTLDEYSEALLNFAPYAPGPILDIGTAYGFMALSILKTGAYVIANDMDVRHLDILHSCTKKEYLSHLELRVGKIPGDIHFLPQSLGAVFASGVLHYLSDEEIQRAFADIFLWLKPNGKFFFVSSTPYTKYFESFRPAYEENKRKGHLFPAFIEDTSIYYPHIHKQIPKKMNLLDEKTVAHLLYATGFHIEKMSLFNIQGTINPEKDIVMVGAIAIKKCDQ
jgi:SAM-dependent methyltransferase